MFDIPTTQNELEDHIQSAQNGEMDPQDFMQTLLQSQIFLPVREKYDIGGLQTSDKAEPLVIEDESGMQVVITFTSPDRARDFLQDYPQYKGGLLTEFSWLLERIGGGISVSLNPGLDVGIDMEPEMLDALRLLMEASKQPPQGIEAEE